MKSDNENDFEKISEWLRSERPPFSEEDRAAMRRAVWREIEARPRPEGAFWPGRFAFAGGAVLAAAVVLVAVLWLRPATQPSVPVPTPVAEGPSAGPAVAASAAKPPAEESPIVPTQLASVAPRRLPAPAQAAPAESVPVKIEFQTANPNVRIIWLVKKGEAVPHSNPSGRKEEIS